VRVYVESNFVLELTLAQRQHRSCEAILDLCSAGTHRLLIPAFCIPESHHALVGKLNSRNRVRQDLLTQRNQLLRTSYHSNLVSSLDDVNILLSQSADAEIERLRSEIEKITQVATLIPLDKEVVETAAELHGDGRIENREVFQPHCLGFSPDRRPSIESGGKLLLKRRSRVLIT
jgi:predicted nucleic acid-binding protein